MFLEGRRKRKGRNKEENKSKRSPRKEGKKADREEANTGG